MKTVCTFAFLLLISAAFAQQTSRLNLGFGAGLDYGGFGTGATLTPSPKAGIFLALGYNLNGLGYNIGANYKFQTEKKVNPYVIAMYGYNAVLIENSMGETRKTTYYGVNFGAGIEYVLKNKRSSLNFEILVPIRTGEFHDRLDYLKSSGYDVNEPLPVAFSIGYHIAINTSKSK